MATMLCCKFRESLDPPPPPPGQITVPATVQVQWHSTKSPIYQLTQMLFGWRDDSRFDHRNM